MDKGKMKAKCEAWIKEGMGACRAPITYDELYDLLVSTEKLTDASLVNKVMSIGQTSELLRLLKGE